MRNVTNAKQHDGGFGAVVVQVKCLIPAVWRTPRTPLPHKRPKHRAHAQKREKQTLIHFELVCDVDDVVCALDRDRARLRAVRALELRASVVLEALNRGQRRDKVL